MIITMAVDAARSLCLQRSRHATLFIPAFAHVQTSRLRLQKAMPPIYHPDCSSKPEPVLTETFLPDHLKHQALAEAGYTHVEGAPEPLPLTRPEFSLRELRAAIPPHCFERSLIRSSGHLIKNLAICGGLLYGATWINQLPPMARFVAWPLYWFLQGSYLTGLWILGHECGHHAFSAYERVNDAVGMAIHSSLLVPYFSWQISHRHHHSNTGSCENDEVFVPITKTEYKQHAWSEHIEDAPLYNVYQIVMMLTVGWMPGYLVFNATGPAKYRDQPKSHFNPHAALYTDRERHLVVLSDVAVLSVLAVLLWLTYMLPAATMVCYYWIPFACVNAYIVLVTFLQHTDTFVPHFREGEWSWLRGALCTVDRDFGVFLNDVFHRVTDTHVCHHLFSKIPFYHAPEATEAIKPILGKFYLKDATPIPLALWRAYYYCKYVDDDGKVVFYRQRL